MPRRPGHPVRRPRRRAIALLYGAALGHILMLRISDVVTVNGRCHLRLGQHPVLLPPAIARLIRDQAAAAAARPAAPGGSRWLFPGQTGLRPVTPLAAVTHLNSHGIHVRAGRTAALIDLAGQLPAGRSAAVLPPSTGHGYTLARSAIASWARGPPPLPDSQSRLISSATVCRGPRSRLARLTVSAPSIA